MSRRLSGVKIQSGHTGQCLAPVGGSNATAGTQISTLNCTDSGVAHWDMNYGSGQVVLTDTVGQDDILVMDAGSGKDDGESLTVEVYSNGSFAQIWYLTTDNRIAITDGDECLEMDDDEMVKTEPCAGADTNQVWWLLAGDNDATLSPPDSTFAQAASSTSATSREAGGSSSAAAPSSRSTSKAAASTATGANNDKTGSSSAASLSAFASSSSAAATTTHVSTATSEEVTTSTSAEESTTITSSASESSPSSSAAAASTSSEKDNIDAVKVAIVHQLADAAIEEPGGESVARFVLTFWPSWSLWEEARRYPNQSGTDNLLHRVWVLIGMMTLIGYSANASAIELHPQGEEEELDHSAVRAAVTFWLVINLTRVVAVFYYALRLSKFRSAHVRKAIAVLVPMFFLLPLIWVTSRPAQIVLATLLIIIDIMRHRPTLSPSPRPNTGLPPTKARRGRGAVPVLNIEHAIKRLGAFIFIVLGEMVMNVVYTTSKGEIGVSHGFGKAALGLMVAWAINYLYMLPSEPSAEYEHALRRSWLTGILSNVFHWPLSSSLVLASAACGKMVANEEVETGVHWHWGCGVGFARCLLHCLILLIMILRQRRRVSLGYVPLTQNPPIVYTRSCITRGGSLPHPLILRNRTHAFHGYSCYHCWHHMVHPRPADLWTSAQDGRWNDAGERVELKRRKGEDERRLVEVVQPGGESGREREMQEIV
ncbi:hypothetical protein IAR50_007289 [Cryptococcus sp. DSM 104548]